MKTILSTLVLLMSLTTLAIGQDKWFLVKGGSWKPETEIITKIQTNITNYINQESKNQGRPITNLENYSFQYQGMTENGSQYVFINALCEYPKDINLRKNMYIVFDGGECYFTVKYDKNKNIFYQLVINGEA